MFKLPRVAIVGRPNVGKSALFNRLLGERIAIVDEAEGVTRDRLIALMSQNDKLFELVDTGGIDPKSQATFNDEIRIQSELAIDESDVLVLVVNSQVGITSLDEQLARRLLKTGKPCIIAVNKIDHNSQEPQAHIFRRLGISEVIGVSAQHGFQVMELAEWIAKQLPETPDEAPERGPKIALIGRPNVGKSTILNTLLDEERSIVSPIAGTTRDSLDCFVTFKEKEYTFIDTAGIRRKAKHEEVVEKFAHIRTERAIERCDLVVLMLDATAGLTSQEKRIAKLIEDRGRGCILFFNKWDLVKGYRMEHCLEAVRKEVPFLGHCPAVFGSAQTGRNVEKIFEHAEEILKWRDTRVPTGELNRFLEKAIQFNHPPMLGGKRLRIYYLTQVSSSPPTFLLFVNQLHLMDKGWKRYLINKLRDQFLFTGLPLRFILRDKVGEQESDFEISQEGLI